MGSMTSGFWEAVVGEGRQKGMGGEEREEEGAEEGGDRFQPSMCFVSSSSIGDKEPRQDGGGLRAGTYASVHWGMELLKWAMCVC